MAPSTCGWRVPRARGRPTPSSCDCWRTSSGCLRPPYHSSGERGRERSTSRCPGCPARLRCRGCAGRRRKATPPGACGAAERRGAGRGPASVAWLAGHARRTRLRRLCACARLRRVHGVEGDGSRLAAPERAGGWCEARGGGGGEDHPGASGTNGRADRRASFLLSRAGRAPGSVGPDGCSRYRARKRSDPGECGARRVRRARRAAGKARGPVELNARWYRGGQRPRPG